MLIMTAISGIDCCFLGKGEGVFMSWYQASVHKHNSKGLFYKTNITAVILLFFQQKT